ncbi:MAG: metallopeptidase family protein, partial [Elusimicrobia bacterium]|nr:metallopeptidase family protein [Elusimicrobiota bacterium]
YNVVVCAEDAPGPEAGAMEDSPRLLGLYAGLSRADMRSVDAPTALPARVYLYRRNIAALCATPAELERQVMLTLRHELAHHFGFDDDELRRVWPEGA